MTIIKTIKAFFVNLFAPVPSDVVNTGYTVKPGGINYHPYARQEELAVTPCGHLPIENINMITDACKHYRPDPRKLLPGYEAMEINEAMVEMWAGIHKHGQPGCVKTKTIGSRTGNLMGYGFPSRVHYE